MTCFSFNPLLSVWRVSCKDLCSVETIHRIYYAQFNKEQTKQPLPLHHHHHPYTKYLVLRIEVSWWVNWTVYNWTALVAWVKRKNSWPSGTVPLWPHQAFFYNCNIAYKPHPFESLGILCLPSTSCHCSSVALTTEQKSPLITEAVVWKICLRAPWRSSHS